MSRNDNANFGVGGIGGAGNVGLYTESSTQKYNLGHRLELFDGRVFRYCNFDAAVTVGKMVVPISQRVPLMRFRTAPLPPLRLAPLLSR